MKRFFPCICITLLLTFCFSCDKELPQPVLMGLPTNAVFHIIGGAEGDSAIGLVATATGFVAIGHRRKVAAPPRSVGIVHGVGSDGRPTGHSAEYATLGNQSAIMALKLDDTGVVVLLRHRPQVGEEGTLLWWLDAELDRQMSWTPDSADAHLVADAMTRDDQGAIWLAGNTIIGTQDHFFVLKVAPDGQSYERHQLSYGGKVGGIHVDQNGHVVITGARDESGWRHMVVNFDPVSGNAPRRYAGPTFASISPTQLLFQEPEGYFLLATVAGADGKEHIGIAHFDPELQFGATWTMTNDDIGSVAGALTWTPDAKLLVAGTALQGDTNAPNAQSLLMQLSVGGGGMAVDSTWIYGGDKFDAAKGVAISANNYITVLSTTTNGTDLVMNLMTYPN